MGFCRVQVSACSCASLATSAKLLSSVIAFIKLACWALLSAKSSGCQVLADSTIVAYFQHSKFMFSHRKRHICRGWHYVGRLGM